MLLNDYTLFLQDITLKEEHWLRVIENRFLRTLTK
jgi:hypothetical protein